MNKGYPYKHWDLIRTAECSKYIDELFFSKEQDEKTARSARMIAYTDQEIEQLANQPKLDINPNEYRPIVSK